MSIIRQGFESADLDVPVVLPTLNLDFANSQSLDKRITFSRGSIGTRVNRNGLIETIPANQPRFDFDPVTGECRGLLIEESRANLIVGSNSFGGGDSNYGITASAAVSPDGTTNASLIYEKTTNNFKIHSVGFTAVIGTSYCASAFVKYAGSKLYARLKVGSTNTIIINLTNGAILSSTGTCGVIPYPNGWYRIYSIFTATSTSENLQLFLMNYNGALSQYQGDGSSGYYVYGMQAEAGAFPTSYIPTTASTVTRSVDNAQMTGTNFSSWFNSTEGTIYTQAKSIATISGATRRFLEFVNGSGTERYLLGYNTTSNARFLVTALGVNQADISVTASPSNGVKMCVSYATNNFSSAVNGTLGTRDVAGLVSNPIRITFGSDPFLNANTILSGTISRLTYYPKALSPSQLQYLTQ